MSEDATLNDEGAPGMDAPIIDQDPAPLTQDAGGEEVGAAATATQDGSPKSPRELAIESISATRLKDLEEETGATNIGAEPYAPVERMLRGKIDGIEWEAPESEVIKGYQKDQTASRRLEHAAEENKRLQGEWNRLNAERAAFEQTRKAAPAEKSAAADTETQATPLGDEAGDAKQIYEALVSGDEDQAVKAIDKLQKGRQAEAIPPEKIAAQVRQQIAWDDARERFSVDYKDIAADPLLAQIASNTLTETLRTAKSYTEAFREAGERTRAWVRGAGGVMPQAEGGQPQTDPGLEEKLSRKERIDNPTAINARAAGKPQEQAETPRDVIKQMREARGLPAY